MSGGRAEPFSNVWVLVVFAQANAELSAAMVEASACIVDEPAANRDMLVSFVPLVRDARARHGGVATLVAAADAFLTAVGLPVEV